MLFWVWLCISTYLWALWIYHSTLWIWKVFSDKSNNNNKCTMLVYENIRFSNCFQNFLIIFDFLIASFAICLEEVPFNLAFSRELSDLHTWIALSPLRFEKYLVIIWSRVSSLPLFSITSFYYFSSSDGFLKGYSFIFYLKSNIKEKSKINMRMHDLLL